LRALLTVLLLLTLIGWGACHVDPPAQEQSWPTLAERPWDWRRTADGWERSDRWWPRTQDYSPSLAAAIFPVHVALLEVGLSLAVLVAFPPRKRKKPENSPRPSTKMPASPH
jgi:hypothetical protein